MVLKRLTGLVGSFEAAEALLIDGNPKASCGGLSQGKYPSSVLDPSSVVRMDWMPAASKRACTASIGPKMTVVPLSVTIRASLSTTFPLTATSPYSCQSSPSGAVAVTANGATLNGPLKRSYSTFPKYWTPVSSVLKASPKRQ